MSFVNDLEKLECKQGDSKIMFIHILGIYGDQSTTILKTIISGIIELLQEFYGCWYFVFNMWSFRWFAQKIQQIGIPNILLNKILF